MGLPGQAIAGGDRLETVDHQDGSPRLLAGFGRAPAKAGREQQLGQVPLIGRRQDECRSLAREDLWQCLQRPEGEFVVRAGITAMRQIEQGRTNQPREFVAATG